LIATVAQLAAVIAAGLLLLSLAWHRPGWVIFVSLSVATFLDLFQIGIKGVNLGINFYVDDAACVVVLVTGFLVLMRYHRKFPRDAVPCLALLVLVALSFSRGFNTFGLKAAGNSSRELFLFVMPALAIMLLQPAFRLDAGRLARWLGLAGLCLSTVALLRWVGVLYTPIEQVDTLREVIRSLNANYAFVVGQAFIAAIYLPFVERRSAWWWVGAGMLGVVTLSLQHRSVWVATAAGLAWLVMRNAPRLSPVRWFALGAVACVSLGMIMVVIPQALGFTRNIVAINVQEVEGKNSTLAWRIGGYEEATARLFDSDAVDILIGPPAGWAAGLIDTNFASTGIHSRYIDTLAYYGIIGFAVLLLWLTMLAKRIGWTTRLLRGRPARNHTKAYFLEALLLSEIVYMIPYNGGILQSAVLGLIWVAANQKAISIGARRVAFARYQFDKRNKPATLVS
jgi:hypothetical protein